MKRIFAGVAASLLSTAAFAADMPVKAQPPLVSYAGSGFYWGITTEGGVQQNSLNSGLFVNGLVNGNLSASGGGVGGTIGWLRGNGTRWMAFEVTGMWQNISAAVPVAGLNTSMASRWSATQVVKFNGVEDLLAYLPNLGVTLPGLSVPAVPFGGVVPNTSHPYMMLGVTEFGVDSTMGVQSGHTVAIAPLFGMGIKNQLTNSAGQPSSLIVDVSARVEFVSKGVTLDFTNGQPNFGPALKAGNRYIASLSLQLPSLIGR